ALNFGLHGTVIFLFSHYRSQEKMNINKTMSRLRFYLSFYAMFCIISMFEFIGGCWVMFSTKLKYSLASDYDDRANIVLDWPLVAFSCITFVRFSLALGCSIAFF